MRYLGLAVASVLFTLPASASGPSVSSCPSTFHSVNVHSDAKLCQIFDSGSPSSMVYHVKSTPQQAIDYFLEDNRLSVHSTVRNRTLMMSADKNHRVVVSPDGTGSQIDILIIAPQS